MGMGETFVSPKRPKHRFPLAYGVNSGNNGLIRLAAGNACEVGSDTDSIDALEFNFEQFLIRIRDSMQVYAPWRPQYRNGSANGSLRAACPGSPAFERREVGHSA